MPQLPNIPCIDNFWSNPIFQILTPCSPIPSSLRSNKELVLPVWRAKRCGNFWDKISLTGCKWSSLNALGTENPVSHSLLGESHFPIFSSCSLLRPSAVIRNWSSQYEGKSGDIFWRRSAYMAGNGPVWMPQGQKPLCRSLLNPLFSFSDSGVIRKWALQ